MYQSDIMSYTEIMLTKEVEIYKISSYINDPGLGSVGVCSGCLQAQSIFQHECFNIEILLKSNTQRYDPNQDPKSRFKEYTFKEKQYVILGVISKMF